MRRHPEIATTCGRRLLGRTERPPTDSARQARGKRSSAERRPGTLVVNALCSARFGGIRGAPQVRAGRGPCLLRASSIRRALLPIALSGVLRRCRRVLGSANFIILEVVGRVMVSGECRGPIVDLTMSGLSQACSQRGLRSARGRGPPRWVCGPRLVHLRPDVIGLTLQEWRSLTNLSGNPIVRDIVQLLSGWRLAPLGPHGLRMLTASTFQQSWCGPLV